MGAKLEEKVLRSIAQYRMHSGRYLLNFAEGVAAELTALLGETPGVEAITPAGSLRRGRETVGDLDLLVTGPAAQAALDRFIAWPGVQEVLGQWTLPVPPTGSLTGDPGSGCLAAGRQFWPAPRSP